MTTDINQRLAEIKERAERATEGPWRMRPKTYDDWGYIRSPDDSFVAVARAGSFQSDIELDEHRRNKTDPTQHNMDFIANARSDVPFLLADRDNLLNDRMEFAIQLAHHDKLLGECKVEIERLTAERDAAWEAGRDAAAKAARDFADCQYINGKQSDYLRTRQETALAVEAHIRALATSKPE